MQSTASFITWLTFTLVAITPLTTAAPTLQARQTNKPGLAYSPYLNNGNCKTRDQVLSDINHIRDFRLIRSYGTSCDQVRNIMAGAKLHNTKVMLGIYDIQNLNTEVQNLITSVNGDWGMVDTISIGNEHVQNNLISASDLATHINNARVTLRNAGYGGPVIGIDTFDAVIRNPVICQASDYAGVNIHPWFDVNTVASEAGQFIRNQIARVETACPGKRVVVTETGWPYRGDSHGKAVASRKDQENALRSEYAATGSSGIFLGPFDDLWKNDHPGSFNAEKYWGIENFGVF